MFGHEEGTFRGGAVDVSQKDVGKPMIKIQMKELDDQLTLQIEGRLAGAFVPELENCWQAARANQPNLRISIDLKSVTSVDRAGRSLLQLMHRDGVGFLRAGLALQDILEDQFRFDESQPHVPSLPPSTPAEQAPKTCWRPDRPCQ